VGDGKYLNLTETLAYLGVGKTTLYKLGRLGYLRRRKWGGIVRWKKSDCDAWIRRHMRVVK